MENYWNCRILEHNEYGETWYDLHEVHYNENHEPELWTVEGISVHGGSIKDINFCMQAHLRAMFKPILRIEGDKLVETDIMIWPYRED